MHYMPSSHHSSNPFGPLSSDSDIAVRAYKTVEKYGLSKAELALLMIAIKFMTAA